MKSIRVPRDVSYVTVNIETQTTKTGNPSSLVTTKNRSALFGSFDVFFLIYSFCSSVLGFDLFDFTPSFVTSATIWPSEVTVIPRSSITTTNFFPVICFEPAEVVADILTSTGAAVYPLLNHSLGRATAMKAAPIKLRNMARALLRTTL